MSPDSHNGELPAIIEKFDKIGFLFKWLPIFYPKAKGIHFIYQAYVFLPQKLLRINGSVPWPVHFTSRVLYHNNITVVDRTGPGLNANCNIQGRNGIAIWHNIRVGSGVGLNGNIHELDDYDRWPGGPSFVLCLVFNRENTRYKCIGSDIYIYKWSSKCLF